MKMKILKILTVISFFTITFSGPHIGGLWGIYILFLLFDFSIYSLISVVFLSTLSLILISSLQRFRKAEKYIFLVCGVILFIPIINKHLNDLSNEKLDERFLFTSLLFVLIYGITLFFILKKKAIS